jgi:hypothetical protein
METFVKYGFRYRGQVVVMGLKSSKYGNSHRRVTALWEDLTAKKTSTAPQKG